MGKVTKALAALALGAVTAYLFPRRKDSSLPVGESSYFLEDRSGTCGEPIPVYYYKPATWTEDQPVFIAFPGYTRKADQTVCTVQTNRGTFTHGEQTFNAGFTVLIDRKSVV